MVFGDVVVQDLVKSWKPNTLSNHRNTQGGRMEQDWTKFYYAHPHPERLVQEVRQLSEKGVLAQPEHALPLITFLSRVVAANPDRIAAWLDALGDLPEADLRGLDLALWFSGAPTARARLAERTTDPLFDEPPPDFLERAIDGPVMLDVLWMYYFATGELRAVRRIISVLEYMSDFGAAESFRQTAQTDEDRARAMRDAMFQAASWSLGSLMQEHAPLKDYCEGLVRSGDLTPDERCALALVLEKIDPDAWQVEIDPRTSQATVRYTAGEANQPW